MRRYERRNKCFWELECFFRWSEKYSSRMVTLGRTFVPVKSPNFSRERGILCEFCGLNRMLSQLCTWAIEMNWISHKAKHNKGPPGPGLQRLIFVNILLLTFSYQNCFFSEWLCLVKQNHMVLVCVRGLLASTIRQGWVR